MTTAQKLPSAVQRRLRSTSTAGLAQRRWWDDHLRDVPLPAKRPRTDPGETVPVPLDAATAARLNLAADRIAARKLAVLAVIAGLAAAVPGDPVVLVRVTDPSGAALPIRLDLRPAESRAEMLSRVLNSVLAASRAADGAPEDAAAAAAIGVALLPAEDDGTPALLADWPDGGGPVLQVRSDGPAEFAARVAAVTAELAERPHYPAVKVIPAAPDDAAGQEQPAELSPLVEPLAAIWRDLLELDEVRPEDDFFDLGGHSLLALELVAEIRDQITESVTMDDIFQAPTLTGLADRLARLS